MDPTPPLKVVTGNALQAAQTKLFLIAVSMILFGELVIPSLLRRLFDKPLATKLLASALFFALPLAIAEIVLRPFTTAHLREKTTLFVRDAELGWRMRPDCETSRW